MSLYSFLCLFLSFASVPGRGVSSDSDSNFFHFPEYFAAPFPAPNPLQCGGGLARADFSRMQDDFQFFLAHTGNDRVLLSFYRRLIEGHPFPENQIDWLDFGAGNGRFSEGILKRFEKLWGRIDFTLVDVNQDALKEGIARMAVYSRQRARASAVLLEPPESKDVIVSNHVLQYLPDPEMTFNELVATLRPGGIMAVTVPGHENALNAMIDRAFRRPLGSTSLVRRENFGSTLKDPRVTVRKSSLTHYLAFADSPKNRDKINRFNFGTSFYQFPVGALRQLFDPYVRGTVVMVPLEDEVIVVEKR